MTKDQLDMLKYIRDMCGKMRAIADEHDLVIVGDELGECIKECNQQIVESRHPISLVYPGWKS